MYIISTARDMVSLIIFQKSCSDGWAGSCGRYGRRQAYEVHGICSIFYSSLETMRKEVATFWEMINHCLLFIG